MTPEGKVLTDCIKYLHRRGVKAWRNSTGAYQARPGVWYHFGLCKGSADIIGLLPGGRFLAVETKADGGRLAPEQAAFLETIRGYGGLAVVAKGWKELDRVLRESGYNNDVPLFRALTPQPP